MRPGNRRRVSIQAKRIAGGRLNATLRMATLKLRRSASLSPALNQHGAGVHGAGSILCSRTIARDTPRIFNGLLSRRGASGGVDA